MAAALAIVAAGRFDNATPAGPGSPAPLALATTPASPRVNTPAHATPAAPVSDLRVAALDETSPATPRPLRAASAAEVTTPLLASAATGALPSGVTLTVASIPPPHAKRSDAAERTTLTPNALAADTLTLPDASETTLAASLPPAADAPEAANAALPVEFALDERRARLLAHEERVAMADPTPDGRALAPTVREQVTRKLDDDQLYASVRRLGYNAESLSFRF
jgi:hypothetical protein